MKYVRMLYYVIANTLILLFFVLVATHCLMLLRDFVRASPEEYQYRYLPDVVKDNYRHMKPGDVDTLLKAHESYSMKYAPWVGYREAPFKSRFLNIDEYGIRSNGKSSEGIEKIQNAIWFFGGSTTWGAGVADGETIPAQLEKLMGRPVVNLGVNAFYSEQENRELVEYLRLGYRPAMAAFLDGINEACDILLYQDQMELIFAKAQEGYKWDPVEIAKPVVHAFDRLSRKLKKLQEIATDEPVNKLICERYGKRQALRVLHAQIMAERDSLCRLYALECLTFVQPFAGVHGRHEDMSSLGEEERQQLMAKFAHLEPNWRSAKSIFVTDALDKLEKHAYIDGIHYSAEGNRLIARAIAAHLTTPRR
jgi:hypothetical protein